MLINLSNHPSRAWGPKQMQAAQEFGEILDIPFPHVPPEADGSEVGKLVMQYHNEIVMLLNATPNESHAVHVMGELNFCFLIITLLKARGITCVASTTERIVTEVNKEKKSVFNFIKFRRY